MIVEYGAPAIKNVDRMSADLRDFVARCLEFDPKKRMTVEQLLRHDFIQRYISQPNPFSGKL